MLLCYAQRLLGTVRVGADPRCQPFQGGGRPLGGLPGLVRCPLGLGGALP
ncbi:hypothetical protein HMPREF1318_0885 [Actinomyces massiliensis F0489]|uniref:Uncharacterized protein n=1 Tax=Actinomyces massiliensis F0489 TaxID=1125718 RepID=J0X5N7_9ACTO|nr:hypothetical protein HMPREF1318_0885 [Actinomyces massiliensis F0489]